MQSIEHAIDQFLDHKPMGSYHSDMDPVGRRQNRVTSAKRSPVMEGWMIHRAQHVIVSSDCGLELRNFGLMSRESVCVDTCLE